VNPTVRVTATHWDPDEFESAPVVQGIEVTFTFTDPADNVTVVLATTNADGIASVPWVLGPDAGTNTLDITGGTLTAVTLEATAEDAELDLDALANEALEAFLLAYAAGVDDVVTGSALLSDEAIHTGTFPTRLELDRRDISVGNGTLILMYVRLQRARALLANAADVLQAAAEEAEINDSRVVFLRLQEAFSYVALAENYCSGVPLAAIDDGELVFGEQQTTTEMLTQAVARFDEAIALAEAGEFGELDVDPVLIGLVGRARALLSLNDLAGAQAAAAGVPTSFGALLEIDLPGTGGTLSNSFYFLNTVTPRISVASGEGGNGLDYVTAEDPRLDIELNEEIRQDGITQVGFHLLSYPQFGIPLGPSARVPHVSGIEARLIEAEAQLAIGNTAGALAELNETRAVAGLPALATIDVDVLFRERAFWLYATGHRLSDMRRLVRQYDRTQDEVFPTGAYPRNNLIYGSDVNFPIPVSEATGSFACFDREA
jgi:hypothetical protein